MNRNQTLATALSLSIFLTACGGGGDDGHNGSNGGGGDSSSAYSENSVALLSNRVTLPAELQVTKSVRATTPAETQSSCTLISDNYSNNGSCITPTQVTGRAEQAHLLMTNSNVHGGTRLLGQSEYDSTPGAIFEGEDFDLSSPTLLVTNNTLLDQYAARDQYDALAVTTAYYQAKFPVTYNTSTTQWVTMTLAKYGQPFASTAAVTNAMTNCGLSAQEAQTPRFQEADLLTGLSFQRGDYLFCVKDNEGDTCAASDFQWLDTNDNSLVSSRPGAPKTSHWLANDAVNCTDDGGGRVSFNFGPFGIYADIPTANQFKLWADFSHGDLSNQWPNASNPLSDVTIGPATEEEGWVSPYFVYYYQDCSSGSCATAEEGAELYATLEFNTDGMIFVEDMNISALEAQTNLGDILAKVHTKDQWAFDQRSINSIEGYDAADIAGITVAPTIGVSRAINNPPEGAVVTCPGNPECPQSN